MVSTNNKTKHVKLASYYTEAIGSSVGSVFAASGIAVIFNLFPQTDYQDMVTKNYNSAVGKDIAQTALDLQNAMDKYVCEQER